MTKLPFRSYPERKMAPVAIEVMQPFPDGLEVTSRGALTKFPTDSP